MSNKKSKVTLIKIKKHQLNPVPFKNPNSKLFATLFECKKILFNLVFESKASVKKYFTLNYYRQSFQE